MAVHDQSKRVPRTRACVFCGDAPDTNRPEEVLPRWLLGWADTPKQPGCDGSFSLWQWKVPACERCNSEHSDLESRIRHIFDRIRGGQPLNGCEIDALLDWVDLVRVKMWLSATYMDRSVCGIQPIYHAKARMGQSDRILYVGVSELFQKMITLNVFRDRLFYQMPIFCGVCVNGIFLFSMSSTGIASRVLGLPHYVEQMLRSDGTVESELVIPGPGIASGRYEVPRFRCHAVLQSVYPEGGIRDDVQKLRAHLRDGRLVPVVDVPEQCRNSRFLTEGKNVIFPFTHCFDFELRAESENILRHCRSWVSSIMKRFPFEADDTRLIEAQQLAQSGRTGLPLPECAWPDTTASQGVKQIGPGVFYAKSEMLNAKRMLSATWVGGKLKYLPL